MSEISKFCNFWAISTCNTSKKSIFHIELNFKQKKYDLFEEKLKKSKLMLSTCLQSRVSQIFAKKIENCGDPCYWKVFKLKVTKWELIISIELKMVEHTLEVGLATSPVLIRVEWKWRLQNLNSGIFSKTENNGIRVYWEVSPISKSSYDLKFLSFFQNTIAPPIERQHSIKF